MSNENTIELESRVHAHRVAKLVQDLEASIPDEILRERVLAIYKEEVYDLWRKEIKLQQFYSGIDQKIQRITEISGDTPDFILSTAITIASQENGFPFSRILDNIEAYWVSHRYLLKTQEEKARKEQKA